MSTRRPITLSDGSQAQELRSPVERLEQDAALSARAAGDGLDALEVAAVVLLGLVVCPPLAILVVVVAVPLLVTALALALLAAVISIPYLLVEHFRHRDGAHGALLAHRLRGAGRALRDLAPHRIVADARRLRGRR